MTFENKSKHENSLESIVEAYSREHDVTEVIIYLRAHKEDIGEFCLQLRDLYGEKDTSTPYLLIANILEKLLK
ncbi:MAG: hypothetical protein HYT37_00945 [Candidatus Sungbacteria bacterium]|nr:hypothetical protein [Candidatus Sungbacteria bacterium]